MPTSTTPCCHALSSVRPGAARIRLEALAGRRILGRLAGIGLGVLPALLAGVTPLTAQQPVATPEVFRRYADGVVKIEVMETASAGKASVGSGFYVDPEGGVITNYHVISKLVHDPERYRAELVERSGTRRPVQVSAVDVVHDLALLKTEHRPDRYFRLAPAKIAQGIRLYALGHPADLGLSIVEGTYNGLLEHTLYDRLHFTGSLNPGMSGGPAITETGQVVGINNATAGNQLSFLVPVERVLALIESREAPAVGEVGGFLETIGAQIREYQDLYLERLFTDSVPTVEIEGYSLPTQPADFFNCWADITSDEEDAYEIRTHSCSTDDFIYISRDHSSGIFSFEHEILSRGELNTLQFFSLYSDHFQWSSRSLSGREFDVTPFSCEVENVQQQALKFRTAFCVRRYKKYDGLYDVIFKLAVLGVRDVGLISGLTMSGVSFENAQRIARAFLENVSWEP